MDTQHPPTCGARNRTGQPCGRQPTRGTARCHFHGGAPGAGAQPGNANALKHGFYSQRLQALAGDFAAAAEEPLDLSGEIALLRVVFARAVGSAPPQVVALIAGTLCRLMKAQTDLAEIAAEADHIKPWPGGLAERLRSLGWGQGTKPKPIQDEAPQP